MTQFPRGSYGSTMSRVLTLSRRPRSAARVTLSAVRHVCRCRDRYQSSPATPARIRNFNSEWVSGASSALASSNLFGSESFRMVQNVCMY